MGYVLPWGQMSFWGAKVITGLFGAIPLVGEPIQQWLLGGFAPDNAALNRFFSLHYLLPFVIVGVVILHIWALHIPGSSNPTGVEVKSESDTVPFHPYFIAKDGWAVGAFLLIYCAGGVLRAQHAGPPGQLHPGQPDEHAGAHRARMVLLAVLRDPARLHVRLPVHPGQADGRAGDVRRRSWSGSSCPGSTRRRCARANYRPLFRKFFWFGLIPAMAVLFYCGGAPAEEPYVMISQIASLYYFAHFLIILPIVSSIERPDPLPFSITEAVLGKDDKAAARRARPELQRDGKRIP